MEMFDGIQEFLIFLEFQTACSMEMHNINYSAMDELVYKTDIHLN